MPLQDTALTALKVSAQLCGELLGECHTAPPEALLTAAMQLHDHALLVRMRGARREWPWSWSVCDFGRCSGATAAA